MRDPTGAIVTGAHVLIRQAVTGDSRSIATDDKGRFKADGLAPGHYTVTISQPGFKETMREVDAGADRPVSIEIKLELEPQRAEVKIGATGAVAANADPSYRALRDGTKLSTYVVNNLVLKRDAGTLTLRSGRVSFLAPVMNRTVKAVFTGDGEFDLTPAVKSEKEYMQSLTGQDSVAEPFEKLALAFTDNTAEEIKKQAQPAAEDPLAAGLLKDFQSRVRRGSESARSFVEAILTSEDMENVDAEILRDLYNPGRPGFFSAYIFGKHYRDLRFFVKPRGALPQILSPEEVAVISDDPDAEKEGIWYLAHFAEEYQNGRADSEESHALVDAEHYRIETVVNGEKLTSMTSLTFTCESGGERIVSFGLLPNLRVSRVRYSQEDLSFIQEDKKLDGSFYVVMPQPMEAGRQYQISIEYQGDKVIEDAGGGNFAVGARTSWYPSVNAFNDRATFDLTFKVPKRYVLVSVGKRVKEEREGDYLVSHWVSDLPLAVAGFNYGNFKRKEVTDDATKYQVEGFATSDVPDYLKQAEGMGSVSPSRLLDGAMVDAENSIRVYNQWFGEAPYGRIAITEQPEFNFGQSWPSLVYLPISAFMDSTQRWTLLGGISSGLTNFIQEVTPHEVSHQWWGHMIGWASYHDQWLSEGFADFSAGLFLQATEKNPDKYLKYWDRARDLILEKNSFGRRANDAGPIWMGQRLYSNKNREAFNKLAYPKGAYVLHMLRQMMFDAKTGDQRFIEMMHDYVKTYLNQNASTEGFKKIAEKHMTPRMNVDGNGKMDWFFNDWVYGTEIPRYRLEYSLAESGGGKYMLTGTVTQSGVSPSFKMIVPIYLEIDGKVSRLGDIVTRGNSTTSEFKVELPKKPKRVFLNANQDVLASDIENATK